MNLIEFEALRNLEPQFTTVNETIKFRDNEKVGKIELFGIGSLLPQKELRAKKKLPFRDSFFQNLSKRKLSSLYLKVHFRL